MFNKIFCLLSLCYLMACANNENNNNALQIKFNEDSSKIVISNIKEAQLYQLKTQLATDSGYQNLVSVLQTPAEDDTVTIEKEIEGALTMQGDSLLFAPKEPFKKGTIYLVQSIINSSFGTREEMLKSNIGHHLKPASVSLSR